MSSRVERVGIDSMATGLRFLQTDLYTIINMLQIGIGAYILYLLISS